MDCFKSGREGRAEGVADAELGVLVGADWVLPKKSNPNNESPGLLCLGGAGSAFGGGWRLIEGSVVLGRPGVDVSSSKRSTFCDLLWDAWFDCPGVNVDRIDDDLSSFAFS